MNLVLADFVPRAAERKVGAMDRLKAKRFFVKILGLSSGQKPRPLHALLAGSKIAGATLLAKPHPYRTNNGDHPNKHARNNSFCAF